LPELRRIPIVIVSIVADTNRGTVLGAAAVMQKPISRQELHEALVDLGLFPLASGDSLRVLVVDDDPKAVELMAAGIAGMANTVLRAYGGREAIDTARRERPDVILLDLLMPEVDGFDVVAALNGEADTARIPILVVTRQDGHGGRSREARTARHDRGEGWTRTQSLCGGGSSGDVRAATDILRSASAYLRD
jgi:CheY-like chemotaxis protein